jgi:hypothetical protein
MIPALKAIVAYYSDDSAWEAVRPPLVSLSNELKISLLDSLAQQGFAMSGLSSS